MPRKQLSPPELTWQTRYSGQRHIKKSGKMTKIIAQQSNVKELNWNKKSFKKTNVKNKLSQPRFTWLTCNLQNVIGVKK
jgi:hypothetical protein